MATIASFYWPTGAEAASWRTVRTSKRGEGPLPGRYQSVEIGDARGDRAGRGRAVDDLKRDALGLFGGIRITKDIGARLDEALERELAAACSCEPFRDRDHRINMSTVEFDDGLFDRVLEVVGPGTAILTLSTKNLNRVTAVDRAGVWVETERSMALGSGPQLVPAWMIAVAWDRLCDKGELSQQALLNELNVKRSAFVCALLAKFPEVHIRSTRPTMLVLQGD